jgi:ribosomal protein S18 acetylase RimI-like enzyme
MRQTAGPEMLHVGGHRIRVGPWREHGPHGYLVPVTPPDLLHPAAIETAVARLAGQGYRTVLTSALLPEEQEPFLRCGFVVDQRLHLLHARLDRLPVTAVRPSGLRRARSRERAAILSVDRLAFDGFWRLDALAFDEARRATPRSRVRVSAGGRPDDRAGGESPTAGGRRLYGYAITGRAGRNGYLQRLAVHPDHQGRGIGLALVTDALLWLRRRGAERASVNTQEHNDRALALYERAGFVRQPHGLAVLRREV